MKGEELEWGGLGKEEEREEREGRRMRDRE